MKHLEWYQSLDADVQAELEEWSEIGPPDNDYQQHYSVEDVAASLHLTPITVRQYIREGKIKARKMGKKWQVPVDAVARFIYDSTHEMPADADIPMGVVFQWSDPRGESLADYRIVSNNELAQFKTSDDIYRVTNLAKHKDFRIEIFSVIACENFLEDIGLLRRHLNRVTGRKRLYDRAFAFDPLQKHALEELASSEWWNKRADDIARTYENIFGSVPSVEHLRLLRMALVGLMYLMGAEDNLTKALIPEYQTSIVYPPRE